MILVRSPDAGTQLQALRTALSLSLGDRAADLLIADTAAGALAPSPGTEAEHCLATIRQLKLGLGLEQPAAPGEPHPAAEVLPRSAFVNRLAEAEFVQVF
ncbi:MAG: hypothetical protein ABR573_00500 [Candidatus Dormibacteria bacterium]